MDIKTQLMEYENRKHTINTSPDLTTEGRKKAMQKLTAEIDQARAVIVQELRTQWDTLKTKAARNIEQVQQAQSEAAKQWDYSRLEYMARSVKNTIDNAASLADVVGMYNQVKESGDNHARRAWAETASEAIKGKYSSGEAVVFIKQLAQDAAAVIETPQLKELKAQGSELTDQARILNEQTDQAQKFYNPNNTGVFSLPDEFTAMREGVRINQQFNAENLETVTEFSLV